jgi:1-pyrroline-4-hydroxy-2-carboxylate deaminase
MTTENQLNRRQLLEAAIVGASGMVAGGILQAGEKTPDDTVKAATAVGKYPHADPRVRGPFLILSTPFTEKGAVDYDVLVKQAKFMNWCECSGIIWPQSGDSVDLLTEKEKFEGMEALTEAAKKFKSSLCLGVQGKNTKEMLVHAKFVEKLAPTAIISRPPDEGKTEDDLRQYWRALGAVARRPVIFQTTGGVAYKGPTPSVKLMIELAREFPCFGYIKEEAGKVADRIRQESAARPPIRRVLCANGARDWLREWRAGAEGTITERAVLSDVFMVIWRLMQSQSNAAAVRDAFAKLLLIFNIVDPLGGFRGSQLYLWKKRGIFKNMISRHYAKKDVIPSKPIFSEFKLSKEDIAEIDFRFEALTPYLKKGAPDLT